MYGLTEERNVAQRIDIDPNGDIFWDSVEACTHPSEMIGVNSLIEGPFKEKEDWPQSNTCIYEEMTSEAFELWFEKAKVHGKRRTHAEMIEAIDRRKEGK